MEFSSKRKIAVLGNYLPRKCGIATFTVDFCDSLVKYQGDSLDVIPIVMNDIPEGYDYPECVKHEIFEKSVSDYRRAADFINTIGAEVLCIQHEYGIYGGKWGGYLLMLMRNLKIPIVTVLHTVIEEYFDSFQENIFKEMISLSSSVVVMNKLAIDILVKQGIPREKIKYVPHGIPDFSFEDTAKYKSLLGFEGKTTLLTFGLLRKCKGIEFMVKAMRRVVKKHKDVLYIIAGETHPNIIRQQGEKYRDKLISMTKKYGLEDNIIFVNKFLELKDLIEYIYASDFYVIPYQVARQIVSGTLAYAIGAGKAVISTPIKCAEEYIEQDLARQVPFNNYRQFEREICRLLKNKPEMDALRKRAYDFGRNTTWKQVSDDFVEIFNSVNRGIIEYNV